jgi:hypothetical protein
MLPYLSRSPVSSYFLVSGVSDVTAAPQQLDSSTTCSKYGNNLWAKGKHFSMNLKEEICQVWTACAKFPQMIETKKSDPIYFDR